MDILASGNEKGNDPYTEYQKNKTHLLKNFQEQRGNNGTLRLRKRTSNLFRHRTKNVSTRWIDLTAFNKVIHIDSEQLTAEVGGLTTYEEFVAQALKHHCVPAIVPELKSITVGGAIAGLGAESSSFKYGWVHETVTALDVLLSHGEVITCTPENEHRDLFYALPSSYGTLGYVLKATMQLIPAKRYVKLSRLHFKAPEAFFKKMAELVEKNRLGSSVEYIDGVSLGSDLYITVGEFVDKAPYISDYKYMHIYYKSIPAKAEDYLTASDYIWRWDPDWFWCSKYFLMQNIFFRWLLGKWMLKSTVYWKIMHFMNTYPLLKSVSDLFVKKTETVIQDLQIPIERAVEFYQFFKNDIGINPMLICPIQFTRDPDKLLFSHLTKDKLYINFGAYGDFIPSDQPLGYFNKKIEGKVSACNGNKWLYSNVFYSEQEFWKLFDKPSYSSLKKKYDPQGLLSDLYTKCAEKII